MKTPRWKKGIWLPSRHTVKILLPSPPPSLFLLGFFRAKKERANVRNRGFHFDKTFKGLAKFCNTLPKRSQKVKYFLAFPCARCFFSKFFAAHRGFFCGKSTFNSTKSNSQNSMCYFIQKRIIIIQN